MRVEGQLNARTQELMPSWSASGVCVAAVSVCGLLQPATTTSSQSSLQNTFKITDDAHAKATLVGAGLW